MRSRPSGLRLVVEAATGAAISVDHKQRAAECAEAVPVANWLSGQPDLRPVNNEHEDEEGRCCDRRSEGNLVIHVVNPDWMAPVNACGVTEFHACGLILAKNASSSLDRHSIRGNT